MNKEEILDQLDNSREQMLLGLEPLSDEALLQPGVLGDWTVADILVHMTAWESELVTALLQINKGNNPGRWLAAIADVEGYNAGRYAENKGRELDRIFADWHNVRLKLEEWLDSFSEDELSNGKRYRWAKNHSLGQIIIESSCEHEAEHLPEIASFSAEWQAAGQD
jgi:hypothetical protein